jgi:hypothetical protein
MLQKLRKPHVKADYRVIMFNHDAARFGYAPKPNTKEFFIFVGVGTGDSKCCPSPRSKLEQLVNQRFRLV